MKYWYGIILVLILLGCNSPKEEIIDFSDIAPESENYKEGEVTDQKENGRDSLAELRACFVQNGINLNDVQYSLEKSFPDRFGADRSKKYKLVIEGDTVRYNRWVYADSIKSMNAFFNWIDCFTDDCKSFYVNQKANMQKDAFKFMVNDTVVIFIESTGKMNFIDWDNFHDSIGYKCDWNIIVEQQRYGKAKWYKCQQDKKTPY